MESWLALEKCLLFQLIPPLYIKDDVLEYLTALAQRGNVNCCFGGHAKDVNKIGGQ